jgi:hypothetical protein
MASTGLDRIQRASSHREGKQIVDQGPAEIEFDSCEHGSAEVDEGEQGGQAR